MSKDYKKAEERILKARKNFGKGKVFFSATSGQPYVSQGDLRVDVQGNIYCEKSTGVIYHKESDTWAVLDITSNYNEI